MNRSNGMTEHRFMFGEHPSCVEQLAHTMTAMKEAGAKVTVETTLETHHKFVVHTVVAEMPKKEFPVVFTRAKEMEVAE